MLRTVRNRWLSFIQSIAAGLRDFNGPSRPWPEKRSCPGLGLLTGCPEPGIHRIMVVKMNICLEWSVAVDTHGASACIDESPKRQTTAPGSLPANSGPGKTAGRPGGAKEARRHLDPLSAAGGLAGKRLVRRGRRRQPAQMHGGAFSGKRGITHRNPSHLRDTEGRQPGSPGLPLLDQKILQQARDTPRVRSGTYFLCSQATHLSGGGLHIFDPQGQTLCLELALLGAGARNRLGIGRKIDAQKRGFPIRLP